MFDERGNAVLTDFGIAVDVHQKLPPGWGTPPYISPEQNLGETLDCRSDQYALGVLLYEITNGQPLAEGATTIQFTNKLLPQKLEQIIIRLTRASKNDRYPTATRLLSALSELRLEFRQKVLENAELYYKNGNLDLAATELSNYLKDVDPESHTIKQKLGLYKFCNALDHAQSELRMGHLTAARQLLPEKQKEEIHDSTLLEKFSGLEADINRTEAYETRIKECLNKKAFADARESLHQLIKIESENPDLDHLEQAIQSLEEGIYCYEREDYSSAFNKLTDAHKQEYFDLDYLNETLEILSKKLGDEEQRLKDQNQFLIEYQDKLSLKELVSQLQTLTKGDLIFDHSNRVLLYQVYSQINSQIAQLFWQNKQYAEAQKYLDAACSFQPENKKLKQLQLEWLAQIYQEKENYDSAKHVYQKLKDEYDEAFFDHVSEMTIKANIQNDFFKMANYFRQSELEKAKITFNEISRQLEQNLSLHPQYDYSLLTQRLESFKKIIQIAEAIEQKEKNAIEELNLLRASLDAHQTGNDPVFKSIEALKQKVSNEPHRVPPTKKFIDQPNRPPQKPRSGFRLLYIIGLAIVLLAVILVITWIKTAVFHPSPVAITPAPAKSVLMVRQIPDQATLQLNEKNYSFQNGVFVDSLIPGEYRLRIRQPNYYDFDQKIQLLAGQADTIAVEMIPLPPPENSGSLSLTVQPLPDSVFIDEIYFPAVHDNFNRVLAVGNHSLVVQKKNYEQIQRVVRIQPGETEVLNLNLVALPPGSLRIQVQPYATISFDDAIVAENIETTTLDQLLPGTHRVTFTRPDYLGSLAQEIIIEPNKQTVLQKNLLGEYGTLIIKIKIREGGELKAIWANVILNNQETGRAVDYLNTKIFAGQYELDVQRAGYLNRTGKQLISIQKGQTIDCNFELAKE